MSTARWVITATLLLSVNASAVDPEPAIITFADGFTLRGPIARETEFVDDLASGRTIKVAKLDGFEVVKVGPKAVIFSTKTARGATTDPAPLPTRTTYRTKLQTRLNRPIQPVIETIKTHPFNDKWIRRVETRTAEGLQIITQQVTSLDPVTLLIESPNDQHSMASYTTEEDPDLIRKILGMHPQLRDTEATKPDILKRLKIASFLIEIGQADGTRRAIVWTNKARQEIELLSKLVPEELWSDEAKQRAKSIRSELEQTEAGVYLDELEAAIRTGRQLAARQLLEILRPIQLSEKQLSRLTVARAAVEATMPNYELTVTRLSATIDSVTGFNQLLPHAALTGVAAVSTTPDKSLDTNTTTLVEAAKQIRRELSPDTASRLELFKDAASQIDNQTTQNQHPEHKYITLLAYAVSGWTKGRNGADSDIPGAVRSWQLRKLALSYLREPLLNNRAAILANYQEQTGTPLVAEELTQMLTLLPPIEPIDLDAKYGSPVSLDDTGGVPGVVMMNTGPAQQFGEGIDYSLRLPPEYQHGRTYPLLIAIPGGGLTAARLMGALAEQCERNGYILAAPVWSPLNGTGRYDFSGQDHSVVTVLRRELLRKLQTDPDRIFIFGFAQGADLALDIGMAHPDLFAGVAGFGPYPPQRLSIEYWRNAQRLPVYMVTGERAGTFPALRTLYTRWMSKGFPALLTVYHGRGLQWYSAELPTMFDWMQRKSRVRGVASLRLGSFAVEPWQVLRESDDRFYWIGVADGGLRNPNSFVNGVPKRVNTPAQFSADIGTGGNIVISNVIGVRKFIVWLDRDLIDWSRPLKITINGRQPPGYKPNTLKPDVQFMLEELHRTGDRKLLFLGKIEINSAN